MRYIVIEVDLDKDHPHWPNQTVWKLKDTKTGEVSFACYKSPSIAKEMCDRKNAQCV
jgi:hypothetical protein